MFDFSPTETPLGVPVVASFSVQGRGYVVDDDGTLFLIDTSYEDPCSWTWQVTAWGL